jgi:hypothetical protein
LDGFEVGRLLGKLLDDIVGNLATESEGLLPELTDGSFWGTFGKPVGVEVGNLLVGLLGTLSWVTGEK